MSASYCSSCGTPLSEGSQFCSSCGTPVAGVQPPEPKRPLIDPMSRRTLTAIVVVIGLVFGMYIALKQQSDAETKADNTMCARYPSTC